MSKDVLASGGRRATFLPPPVSQEKWDSIFENFDPAEFIKNWKSHPVTHTVTIKEKSSGK